MVCNQPGPLELSTMQMLKFWKLSTEGKKFNHRAGNKRRHQKPPLTSLPGSLGPCALHLQHSTVNPAQAGGNNIWWRMGTRTRSAPTSCLTLGQLPDLSEPPFSFFKMEIIFACLPHKGRSQDPLMLKNVCIIFGVRDWPFQIPYKRWTMLIIHFQAWGLY